jgi:hypothetical protein
VNRSTETRSATSSGTALAVQSGILCLAMLAAYALVAPIAAWLGGGPGLAAAAVAAGLCFLGTEVALVVARFFSHPTDAWKGMFWGMLPRMGIPLCLGLALQLLGGPLAESGLLVYVIVFYQVALGTEVFLHVRCGGKVARRASASRNAAS